MELRQIKYFLTVARKKSFSTAAKELYVSQSTLSQQIKQLEDELGAVLLERNTRKVILSDYGERFYPMAKQLMDTAEECTKTIMEVSDMSKGELRIGMTYSFGSLLIATLRDFVKDYPGINLKIRMGLMEHLMDLLEDNEIDIALSYDPSHKYGNIESGPIFESSICAIVSKEHPLAGRKSISLQELLKQQLVLPVRGMHARDRFDGILYNKNLAHHAHLEINDINILLKMVSDSMFATVLSKNTIIESTDLVAISINDADTSITGSYHILKGRQHRKAAKEFISRLVKHHELSRHLEEKMEQFR